MKLSILVELEEIDSPKDKLRKELDEIRAIFTELKKLNGYLDKVMANMDKANQTRIDNKFQKIMGNIEEFDKNF